MGRAETVWGEPGDAAWVRMRVEMEGGESFGFLDKATLSAVIPSFMAPNVSISTLTTYQQEIQNR